MRYKWLNRANNSRVIIFFNGWGMDENIVKNLEFDNYDVLMFYDYNTLDCDFDFSVLDKYSEKNLVAWSMGVMCATLFDVDYMEKVAINGTLKPIDNEFGIPFRIYDLTLKGFSEKGAEKFIRNMFSEPAPNLKINREYENQKSELFALKNYQANFDFVYDKILISDCDKIIPTKNQCKYWNIEPNLKSGHAPFNLFKSWGEIL